MHESASKIKGSVYFTAKILAVTHQLKLLLCCQSNIQYRGMIQFE